MTTNRYPDDEAEIPQALTRKRLLQLGLLVPAAAAMTAATATSTGNATEGPQAVPADLEPTPACHDGDAPTIAQTEGPYFKPNSPERSDLVIPGARGTRLTVSGYVFTRSCRPVDRALLDFWQADDDGAYDNYGFNWRGHQYTDATGHFSLSTIVPGLYPGRTRHIHVKVQAPNQRILTTQLYFPNEPRNNTDTIFDRRLLMTVRTVPTGKEGTYDFILNIR
ncbi:dioxygenase-like protein [Nocardia tenerifensis]|uniref:Dioxygenase-like protein n=1 Tax=Nocardia tenerifensis TaxID=228006 RepID=A0A318L055_9NOCA|nr:dioxygenase [Nocardia tenerifensis]PXX71504.1 dioxygenase-like protein [Nocardia tenerifensis]